MLDLILKGGIIIDGTGGSRYTGDIGVSNGKIIEIGMNLTDGVEVIDISGKCVSPGFIDMHTHSDVSFFEHSGCDSKTLQGVTTELVGCCGYSFYPSDQEGLERLKTYIEEDGLEHLVSESFETFVEKTEHYPKANNWGTYIGHGTLRAAIVGYGNEKASESQISKMKSILASELRKGAFGLSLGVAYAPGMFTDIDEFIELAGVCAEYGRIITAHIRNENTKVFEAIEELIEIGRQSGAHVHISHLKLGYGNWYKTDQLFKMIEDARNEGINLTIEQYPYIASSTGLSAVLPNWVHDGGTAGILRRFSKEREAVLEGIRDSNSYKMGLDRVVVVNTKGYLPEGDGKNVDEIAEILKMPPEEAVVWLLEKDINIPTIRFTMEEDDVMKIMAREDCAVISDGSAYSIDPKQVNGMPHPRSFGTFPRFLRLNREKSFMSIEKAIYKMTGLPKKLVGLSDRGLLKVGQGADFVVFDSETISDRATFDNSIRRPVGIDYVIVNGKVIVKHGKLTEERPGETLRFKSEVFDA